MKKKRLIPILLLRNGWLVQSKEFSRYQNLGNPETATLRLSQWASDELIFLDISRNNIYDLRRDDLGCANRHTFLEIIENISKVVFMPMTVGGKIKSLFDIEKRLSVGADKVSINTQLFNDEKIIQKSANEFGSQCIVASIDVKKENGKYFVYSNGGQKREDYLPIDWAKKVESLGAGEILLNSIDRDGMKTGYDIELIKGISDVVSIPVIAAGGVGEWSHFGQVLSETKVDAVAAANIFQYSDQSVYLAKKYLYEHNFNVRPPDLLEI